MTYLLIGSLVVLSVALWYKWANRIDQENESGQLIREARARAAERDKQRTSHAAAAPLVDWDMASQVQTAIVTTEVPEVSHLTPEEALTVSVILADIEELPTIETDGVVVKEIDMDAEFWNKKNG